MVPINWRCHIGARDPTSFMPSWLCLAFIETFVLEALESIVLDGARFSSWLYASLTRAFIMVHFAGGWDLICLETPYALLGFDQHPAGCINEYDHVMKYFWIKRERGLSMRKVLEASTIMGCLSCLSYARLGQLDLDCCLPYFQVCKR